MLEIKQLAVYWNSNAQDNWSKNKEFTNLSGQKLIDYSKKFTEQLKKRYHQFQQNLSTNSVYLLQPCDIRIRFRKNLSPSTIIDIPRSTTALEISSLIVNVDDEMYKDVQYLSKFFSWHSKAVKNNKNFKFRPPYNVPVCGNAAKYWTYAIKSVIYSIRKQKKEAQFKQKRQLEMLELS